MTRRGGGRRGSEAARAEQRGAPRGWRTAPRRRAAEGKRSAAWKQAQVEEVAHSKERAEAGRMTTQRQTESREGGGQMPAGRSEEENEGTAEEACSTHGGRCCKSAIQIVPHRQAQQNRRSEAGGRMAMGEEAWWECRPATAMRATAAEGPAKEEGGGGGRHCKGPTQTVAHKLERYQAAETGREEARVEAEARKRAPAARSGGVGAAGRTEAVGAARRRGRGRWTAAKGS